MFYSISCRCDLFDYGAPSVAKLLFDILRHITTYYDTCICRKDMKQVEISNVISSCHVIVSRNKLVVMAIPCNAKPVMTHTICNVRRLVTFETLVTPLLLRTEAVLVHEAYLPQFLSAR